MSDVSVLPTCVFDGCSALAKVRGLCQKHYHVARHAGALPPLRCEHPGCDSVVYGRGKGFCARHFVREGSPPCKVDGCGKASHARGLCPKHLMRLRRHGDPYKVTKASNGAAKGQPCCIAGCADPVARKRYVLGGLIYCGTHWKRVKSHGDPHFVVRPQTNSPEDKKRNAAARHRRYYATPHGKLRLRFNKSKYRAIQYGCDWETGIPKEVFIELYSRTHCGICGFFMPTGDRTIDHIVPLSKGGPNSPANLQVAHQSCNSRKGGRNRRSPTVSEAEECDNR